MKTYQMKKIAAQYQDIKAQIKALEEQKAAMEADMKAEMEKRGLEEMEIDTFVIRYKTINGNRFDTTRFKKENATIAAQYTVPTETKRFQVTAIADIVKG